MKNYWNTKKTENMGESNKYRRILYKMWRENTIGMNIHLLRRVIIDAACNYYIIIIPITEYKEKNNSYKKVAR